MSNETFTYGFCGDCATRVAALVKRIQAERKGGRMSKGEQVIKLSEVGAYIEELVYEHDDMLAACEWCAKVLREIGPHVVLGGSREGRTYFDVCERLEAVIRAVREGRSKMAKCCKTCEHFNPVRKE